MDLTSQAGRETAEKIRKEIAALKGDALLEKNAFDQLSAPPDDERKSRQFLVSSVGDSAKAEFGEGPWKGALEAYQRNSGNA